MLLQTATRLSGKKGAVVITSEPVVFEQLWKVADVAKYLQASRSWVYEQAEGGELPSIRLGGLLRFDSEAIRRWAKGAPAQVVQMSARKPNP